MPPGSVPDDVLVAALARTHGWFEVHSGWAPPDEGTMIDWGLEGIGRAPDECLVAEYGVCAHGLASWQVVLDDLVEHDLAHQPVRATARGDRRAEPVHADDGGPSLF